MRAAREGTLARLISGETGQQRADLKRGDRVVVETGEFIPGDGEIVEGIATVDESAITGESAPVIREAGTDHSGVTGGTKVLSDRIVVEITSQPGESFSRPDDRAGGGSQPPEDPQRDRPEPAAECPDPGVRAGGGDPAALSRLRRRVGVDHDRWWRCWSA